MESGRPGADMTYPGTADLDHSWSPSRCGRSTDRSLLTPQWISKFGQLPDSAYTESELSSNPGAARERYFALSVADRSAARHGRGAYVQAMAAAALLPNE